MKSRQPSAIALTRASQARLRRRSLKYALLALIAVMWTTGLAFAQDEEVTVTHAVSNFGEPKYPADFKHFNYVNPNAPKGGVYSELPTSRMFNGSFHTFNSLNSFIFKGEGVYGMDLTFASLMARSGDEPDAMYGLAARSVRVTWVT